MVKFLLLIVSMILCGYANAQEKALDFGIEAGANISSIDGEAYELMDPAIFYTAGLNIKSQLNKKLSVRSGIYYEVKGAQYEILFTDNTGQDIAKLMNREKFHTITVPLMLAVGAGEKVAIHFGAGPFISFLIKQEMVIGGKMDFSGAHEKTENYKSNEFGASVELGIDFPLSNKTRMTVNIRDDFGFTDMNKIPESLGGYTQKLNVLNVMLGILIPIHKKSKPAIPDKIDEVKP